MAAPATGSAPAQARLLSLDVLRGFDMFWIVGGAGVLRALDKWCGNAFTRSLAAQVEHVAWRGFRFYDLVFPLFIFISGAAIALSFGRSIERLGRPRALLGAFKRSVIIFILGIFYNGGVAGSWGEIQYSGVLQLIAMCHMLGALVYCIKPGDWKPPAAAIVVSSLVFWLLINCVSFPDITLDKAHVEAAAKIAASDDPAAIVATAPSRISGVYDQGRNLSNYLDYRYLPGKKTNVYYVNQGTLSPVSGCTLIFLGILAGLVLWRRLPARRAAIMLAAGGAASIALALLVGLEIPIVKKLWTPSFCFLAGGVSAMLLAAFHLLFDTGTPASGRRARMAAPFHWIGMNPITLYITTAAIINFGQVARRIAGGGVRDFFDGLAGGGCGDFVISLVTLALVLLLARFLYKRKIFLSV